MESLCEDILLDAPGLCLLRLDIRLSRENALKTAKHPAVI